jgi:IS30 family transposase
VNTQGKVEVKERFVELRASGLSYDAIAAQLNVSKPTLIGWGRELAREVHNARTLRMDALFEQYAVAKAKRVEVFGKRLDSILTELDKRDMSKVPTEALLKLALQYGESLRTEYAPLTLQGEDEPFDMSAAREALNTTRDTWPV